MKKNEIFHQKIKPKQISFNTRTSNKDIKKNNTNLIFPTKDSNYILKSDKTSNLYKYRRISSEIFNKANKINSTTKKSRINQNNNIKNSNFKGNKNHDLYFSSKTNNLNENKSTYLSNNKNIKGDGTQLNISKSEIQYPFDYSNNDLKNRNDSINNTNSSAENNSKEINLRVSTKYLKKNNKEKLKKYNILSPLNKGNYSFGRKFRQKKKNSDYINSNRKNKDSYSPDIIKYNNNIKEMKSINKNSYHTKRDSTFMNTFNNCSNFCLNDQLYTKRKKDHAFNNTMNQYYFNNKINDSENILDLSDININENTDKYNNYNSSRYLFEENNKNQTFNRQKNNNIKKFILYQNYLIEEFCEYIEEYMLLVVKDNFETFINKLRQYSKYKYNSLLLKRLQTKGNKYQFYQRRDSSNDKSNNSYLSSNRYNNTNNSNINNYCNHLNSLNDFQKKIVRRKTMDNFNRHKLYSEIEEEKTYQRKSQEKFVFKDFEPFGKKDYYNYNTKKTYKEKRYINENFDTNLYIPKKYRNLNNTTANKTKSKKNLVHNHSNTIPYFNNKYNDKSKEISNISNKEKDLNINNGIEEEAIKSKLEQNNDNNDKKFKKIKNHNISCDNKHVSKYYKEKEIENKINSNNKINNEKNNKNLSLINIEQKKENNIKKIYNKKKIKGSQPKAKIYINKQIQENSKGKIIHRNNNNLKKEQIVNLNMNMNLNKKINNKNKNNVEHCGIMTLSSNVSESSYDFEIIQNEKNEFNIISPKRRNNDINPNNQTDKNNIKEKDFEILKNEDTLRKQPENINHKNKLNQENGNIKINYNTNSKEDDLIDSDKKMNNDDIFDNEYIAREIIVKDVSTRDRRINVFIKYIEDYSFYNNKPPKKYILIIFQTDSIFIPSLNSLFKDQRYDLYKQDKFYKNMNDKNYQYKMNKILTSIKEEEERSKVAGSLNNSISIISDEENFKNGHYSYYFLQSIKFTICLLHSIIGDKKKSLYFQFFKILKKIKNDSYLKGLIIQKKNQIENSKKERKN